MPVGDGEDVRVEDQILGREADLIDEQPVRALADATLRSTVSAWPCSSNAITTTPAP
jgi:hypothetical protein